MIGFKELRELAGRKPTGQKVFDKNIYLETGLRYFDYLYSEAMLKDLEPKDIFKRKG